VENLKTPIIDIISLPELEDLAIQFVLAKNGISDPQAFMRGNKLEKFTALRAAVGFAVTITGSTPKPPESIP